MHPRRSTTAATRQAGRQQAGTGGWLGGMPLVTICGLPASGKTTFADGLVAFLRKELPASSGGAGNGGPRRVVLVNEEALRIARREGYRGAWAAMAVVSGWGSKWVDDSSQVNSTSHRQHLLALLCPPTQPTDQLTKSGFYPSPRPSPPLPPNRRRRREGDAGGAAGRRGPRPGRQHGGGAGLAELHQGPTLPTLLHRARRVDAALRGACVGWSVYPLWASLLCVVVCAHYASSLPAPPHRSHPAVFACTPPQLTAVHLPP